MQSKDLQLFLCPRPVCGTFENGRLDIVPVLAQIDPSGVVLFDKRDFLFPAPTFQLLFTPDRRCHILMTFKPHQSIAVVLLCESIVLFPLVLEYALMQTAGYSHV